MKISISLPIFLLLACQGIFSQSENINSKIVTGLSVVRHKIISDNQTGINSYLAAKHIMELENDSSSPSVFNGLFRLIDSYHYFGKDTSQYLKRIEKKLPQFKALSDEQKIAIAENIVLLELIWSEMLDDTAPFKINPEMELIGELSFYGIENNMQVAEIGAGFGMWSLILGHIYDSLDIYVNEINETKINVIKNKIPALGTGTKSRFYIVEGEKSNTLLEGKSLDKIIVRNSFHHFKQKDNMLLSIKNALKENGDLFIFDPIKDNSEKDDGCRKKLPEDEIKKTIRENGFEIICEKKSKNWNWLLLHCRVK